MHNQFSCYIIGDGALTIECGEVVRTQGHRLLGVVTSNGAVLDWCRTRGILSIVPDDEGLKVLHREPFDYLFSIINLRVLPQSVVSAARKGSINFHDSPLPRYGGLHPTSWALMNHEKVHGVSWHLMNHGVDAGPLVKQRVVEISEKETAHSLLTKCFEAALTTFGELVPELAQGEIKPQAQEREQRTYFPRWKRPQGAGLISWDRPAREIEALIRALDFGGAPNALGRAKIMFQGGCYICTSAEISTESCDSPPGTIVRLDSQGLTVATREGSVILLGFLHLCGSPISLVEIARFHSLRAGVVLPRSSPELLAQIDRLNARYCKSEEFWVGRLGTLQPAEIPYFESVVTHEASSCRHFARQLEVPVEVLERAKEHSLPPVELLLTAIGIYLARISGQTEFDIGWRSLSLHQELAGGLENLIANTVPLRVRVAKDSGTRFPKLLQAVQLELALADKHGGFLIDMLSRYPGLQAFAEKGLTDSLGVIVAVVTRLEEAGGTSSDGGGLRIEIQSDGQLCRWTFNSLLISEPNARRMLDQFGVLLESLAEGLDRSPAEWALMRPRVREQVLVDWNNTTTPVPGDVCVHQAIEAQAGRTPEATALVYKDRQISYAELNRRANQLARHLRRLGVGPDRLVGLCVDRSIEMVVGMLGIQKAGGAYVPIDPNYPEERTAQMMKDSGALVTVTQEKWQAKLARASSGSLAVLLDTDWPIIARASEDNVEGGVKPENLAYVIYTSGSTGQPKGVMIEHASVLNFFVGIDQLFGLEAPGVWLAVTSISFDIHVLELSWTLARGFKVVIQEDQVSGMEESPAALGARSAQKLDFSLFYFSSNPREEKADNRYWLLLEGAKFADAHGFSAVWTPERHFHAFGGLYPNPSVTSAAVAVATKNVQIRAGSIVLPIHNPIRIAEEWAMVDNLCNGRVGLSFASGWHANDFAFAPENYSDRKNLMFRGIETIRNLWKGESVKVRNGENREIEVRIFPPPVRQDPPLWITAAGNVETFRMAGELGYNLLTNLLGQSIEELHKKIAVYRDAWMTKGHPGSGTVTVMVHTFLGADVEEVREKVRGPLSEYLKTSFDLIKIAPWAFPAFRQPSKKAGLDVKLDPSNFTAEDMAALLDHAFDRYFETAGLFGTPESALHIVDRLKSMGADEVACLIDFGIPSMEVFASLPYLNQLRELSNPQISPQDQAAAADYSIAGQIKKHGVTHFQCTPSLASILVGDARSLESLSPLKKVLIGGEAMPQNLAAQLLKVLSGDLINMYGPTETTVWSTAELIRDPDQISIGRPIANTQIYILDANLQPLPPGVPGELMIGGKGLARGYWNQPALTSERFVEFATPNGNKSRLYRTGDLARFREDGKIDCLGRLDHQVKLRGHRIELGEIETILNQHRGVRESVVTVREDTPGDQRLVAYVIPDKGGRTSETGEPLQLGWQKLWAETYDQGRKSADDFFDPTFNIAGWNSSYTGSPIPREEMREWLDGTVDRIRSLQPKRVLEIGCGTGLLLFAIAPQCEHYTAIDFAGPALENIEKQLAIKPLPQVSLIRAAAHELASLQLGPFDTVIINSVAQYFPDADYLLGVLGQAAKLLSPEGTIFVGDLRSLPHMEAFHTELELHRAADTLLVSELRQRIERRRGSESELLIDPEFFHRAIGRLVGITSATHQLKRGAACNEVTRYRYDVVLKAGPPKTGESIAPVMVDFCAGALMEVESILQDGGKSVWVRGIPNPRLIQQIRAVEALRTASPRTSVGELRARLDPSPGVGIDPETLWKLSTRHTVQLFWNPDNTLATYDALLLPGGRAAWQQPAQSSPADERPWKQLTNRPGFNSEADKAGDLAAELVLYLRDKLPGFMRPASYVMLNAFPLTPNGKINRRGLPAPSTATPKTQSSFVAPQGAIEETISTVWSSLLRLDQISVQENLFDLGANSLLMVQANQMLKQAIGRNIPLVDLFRFPTISSLAAHLGRSSGEPDEQLKHSQDRGENRREAMSRRRQARETQRKPLTA